MADLRDLIAEPLAAHVDVLNRSMSCSCGGWSKRVTSATLIEAQAEWKLHRADAAVGVMAKWLHDLAAVQWERSTTHDDPLSRELATIRAMYLTDRASELEGDEAFYGPGGTGDE